MMLQGLKMPAAKWKCDTFTALFHDINKKEMINRISSMSDRARLHLNFPDETAVYINSAFILLPPRFAGKQTVADRRHRE